MGRCHERIRDPGLRGVEILAQATQASDRVEALAEQNSVDGPIVHIRSGPKAHRRVSTRGARASGYWNGRRERIGPVAGGTVAIFSGFEESCRYSRYNGGFQFDPYRSSWVFRRL
jgi:hypothetical protein